MRARFRILLAVTTSILLVAGTLATPMTADAAGAATVKVHTVKQLKSALNRAHAGQTIQIADGTYVGRFIGKTSGTKGFPITITGSKKVVLTTGSLTTGDALHLSGAWWAVTGISIKNSHRGVVLDNSDHTRLVGIHISSMGAQGIIIRHGSSYVAVLKSSITKVGKKSKVNGEGIHVGTYYKYWKKQTHGKPDKSDHVTIQGNDISYTPAEGVDVKEGTSYGRILGNVFTKSGMSGVGFADSWIDIKGNHYLVEKNSGSWSLTDAIQIHSLKKGWGWYNVIRDNGPVRHIVRDEVFVGKGAKNNKIYCHASTAGNALSNVPCIAA